jgi:hypothetical protein
MPLVFVHGVGNRPGDGYTESVRVRDLMFRRFLLPAIVANPAGTQILSPLWGSHGAELRWGHASLPMKAIESLGDDQDDLLAAMAAALAADGAPADSILTTVARRCMASAIDLLYAAADLDHHPERVSDAIAVAAQLVAYCRSRELAQPLATERERNPWLGQVSDDGEFVDFLLEAAAGWDLGQDGDPVLDPAGPAAESMGAVGKVRDLLVGGARRLKRLAVCSAVPPLVDGARRIAAAKASHFLGDVFAYLAHRGTPDKPGPIISTVAAALESAVADRGTEPVLVIAHSMGGNIVYDLLSSFRPDIAVDALVTVGSQVGLFEELKLFLSSRREIPGPVLPRVPTLDNIGGWVNVVDRSDFLGYCVGSVFDGAVDYQYATGAIGAHGAYFNQPYFHARLARRVRGLLR